MALGGGFFTSQNKILPGAYINFLTAATASAAVGERGVAAIALALDWGIDGEVFEVTPDEFMKNSRNLFGYDYDSDKLKGLRDLFMNITKLYVYKLNSTSGTTSHASNTYGMAKYSGTCGNKITIKIALNVDDNTKYDVTTIYDGNEIETQTVAAATGLVDNDFVIFDTTATLSVTSGTAMTGGAVATITSAMHQTALDKFESYNFNAIGVVNDEANGGISNLNQLYANWAKRLRDQMGIKIQAVVYNYAADHEGVVNVITPVTDTDWSAASLVYWVLGVIAGTAVNASCLNKKYDGEFTPNISYTQSQLEGFITAGKFALHRVGQDIRILADINSLTTVSADKGEIFKKNQTIRVIDDIATQIAYIFNTKYLGNVPNDDEGRTSLWADIVAHHKELEVIRAIQDFDEEQVTIAPGNAKGSVVVNDAVTVVNAMEQLYMTCVIS